MNLYRTKIILFIVSLMLLIPSLTGAADVPSTENSTANLRSSMAKILGQYAFLTVETMQKDYDSAADLEAAQAAWMQNSDELAAAMTSVYGEYAGIAFKAIWKDHLGFYMNYAKASAAQDSTAQAQANASLDTYSRQLADFMSNANPKLQESALEEAFLQVKSMILDSFKAYAAKDYKTAYQQAQNAYKQMYMTADGITASISAQFPTQYPKANAMTKLSELRSVYERILGENTLLEASFMQKNLNASPDFEAASAALTGNTDEWVAAVGSVYGQAAADALKSIWNSHINYMKSYLEAAAAKDETKLLAAAQGLKSNGLEQAKFFAGANPQYDEASLSAEITKHNDDLLDAFHAYTAGDYMNAYPNINAAYVQMVLLGEELSVGIAAQYPDKFGGLIDPVPAKPSQSIVFKLGSMSYLVNGTEKMMDVAPELKDEKLYIPLRFLAESLGGKVIWDPADSERTTVTLGSSTLVFKQDDENMSMNGALQNMGSSAHLYESRLVVHSRFLADILGWNLTWNGDDETVTFWK